MDYVQEFLVAMPFILFGGITIWVMIFLETYLHFSKMHKHDRIKMSVTNATILALLLMVIFSLFVVFVINQVMK
jgi:hypothetical protein